jgi:sulfite reductase beta subunit-like hemoprotein
VTFDRTQGPTQVRAVVEAATSDAAPFDPWEEIEQREGPLAVGRMRLMGVYDDRQRNRFMLRVRIPGGHIDADQLDAVAGIIRDFGNGWEGAVEPDRFGEITTRQDIQIHWVPVAEIMDMYDRLLSVGITTRGACADTVRNVTGCPYAGVSPDEPFDVTPYILAVHEYFLFNPLNLTLPRKFKIAVEGCPLDCAQVPVNDIGLYAKMQGGQRGFAVWAGGGLGSQPYLAQHTVDFIPDTDALIWCEAIVRIQHRHGERKNRSRARMKYVVKKMGLDKFRQAVRDEVARVEAERGDELRAEVREALELHQVPAAVAAPAKRVPELPGFAEWAATNVRPQRQDGYRAAIVQLPLGDITTEQMRALGAIARRFGNGTLRATDDQNVIVPWIAEAALPAVHAALVAVELGNPDVSTINDVVSCPGMDYCSLAITRSMGMAERIRAHLLHDGEGFAARLGVFGVKISGCPNSCGQHHVGDIGLTGHTVKEDDGLQRPYYSILVGGSVGEGRGRIGKRLGRYREEDASAAVAALARYYEKERGAGERFPEFVDRIGLPRLTDVAKSAIAAESV